MRLKCLALIVTVFFTLMLSLGSVGAFCVDLNCADESHALIRAGTLAEGQSGTKSLHVAETHDWMGSDSRDFRHQSTVLMSRTRGLFSSVLAYVKPLVLGYLMLSSPCRADPEGPIETILFPDDGHEAQLLDAIHRYRGDLVSRSSSDEIWLASFADANDCNAALESGNLPLEPARPLSARASLLATAWAHTLTTLLVEEAPTLNDAPALRPSRGDCGKTARDDDFKVAPPLREGFVTTMPGLNGTIGIGPIFVNILCGGSNYTFTPEEKTAALAAFEKADVRAFNSAPPSSKFVTVWDVDTPDEVSLVLAECPVIGRGSIYDWEDAWRDPATEQLGCGTGAPGLLQCVQNVQLATQSPYAMIAWFLKYPMHDPINGYARWDMQYLVLRATNPTLALTCQHEFMHMFGADDEYVTDLFDASYCEPHSITVTSTPVINGNSPHCFHDLFQPFTCIMAHDNKMSTTPCRFTKGQVGWGWWHADLSTPWPDALDGNVATAKGLFIPLNDARETLFASYCSVSDSSLHVLTSGPLAGYNAKTSWGSPVRVLLEPSQEQTYVCDGSSPALAVHSNRLWLASAVQPVEQWERIWKLVVASTTPPILNGTVWTYNVIDSHQNSNPFDVSLIGFRDAVLVGFLDAAKHIQLGKIDPSSRNYTYLFPFDVKSYEYAPSFASSPVAGGPVIAVVQPINGSLTTVQSTQPTRFGLWNPYANFHQPMLSAIKPTIVGVLGPGNYPYYYMVFATNTRTHVASTTTNRITNATVWRPSPFPGLDIEPGSKPSLAVFLPNTNHQTLILTTNGLFNGTEGVQILKSLGYF